MSKPKILRVTTVPISLRVLLKGQHRFMSQNGFEVIGVSSAGSELKQVAEEEGIKVVELEMTRAISPLKDLMSLWNFYKLCKKERPTIVHSHTPKAGIISMLGSRLAGVPIRLHTVAGLPLMEAKGLKRKVLDIVEKLTYRFATRVYPNSKGLYDFITAHNFTSTSKLKIIANGSSNGIDTHFFSPHHFTDEQNNLRRKELGIAPSDFVFIFVGRIVGDKGIHELVESFRNVEAVLIGGDMRAKLLLVGPLEPDLDPINPKTLQEIEGNPNIISVGYKNDVRPYFAMANALVFPSYREGFPNVVMQAGALGLPSVVSDINGCNEIIKDGENGMIVPVKDSAKLTEAMCQIVLQPKYYEHLKGNARNKISARYEQQVVWDSLLEEYRNLLNEGRVEP